MSGAELALYLVGVPVAVVAVIWALASLGGPQSRRRYRPGRPYDFPPVWYVANHRDQVGEGAPAGEERAALPPGPTAAAGAPQGSTGGASDSW